MEGIQVSVEKAGLHNNIAVIKVGGYIDTTTSAELEHSLDALLKAGTYNIIIDLGNVDYISSAGWGIFISEIKGIREKGGDLKLVRMIPDVYEVFELLEFHYILRAFDTIEEAVGDFDRGGMAASYSKPQPAAVHHATAKSDGHGRGVVTPTGRSEYTTAEAFAPMPEARTVSSLDEKIRQIIRDNPEAGTLKIKQMLSTPRYGGLKISWWDVRRRLKDLGLDSKSKRLEYYKSV
ncbi:MAG: STAS domain-containing protein [candidate division KSB1 bacterium]|nr:STAS domain-containing protein [candidate division KSB1 bacterium]MDZ7364879.1 STAS domain-containing protein [candidate division KSB1 bacterium]MDZ7402982.1 STAS domain-containing protein [candidate division KSB1 bacterium]